MWIVSVMPVGAVAAHKEFSYWSAREVPEGGIVSIGPAAAKQYGLVMSCAPLQDLKQSVRNADFSLKKVRGGGRIFTREFLRAAFEMARWHACGAGAIVYGLTPQWVLQSVSAGKTGLPEAWSEKRESAGGTGAGAHSREAHRQSSQQEPFVGSRETRVQHAKEIAKGALARGKSCLALAPTIIEAQRLADELQEVCDEQVVLLHSGLTATRARAAWKRIAETETSLVVVGTAGSLSAPLRNLGAIILERAGARGYHRTEQRPFLDVLKCAELYAESVGARFVTLSPAPLISQPPSPALSGILSLERERSLSTAGVLSCPLSPHGERAGVRGEGQSSATPPHILDMRPPPQTPDSPVVKHRFQLFGQRTLATIEAALAAEESILLICARRGLATHTVCDDCGTIVLCEACDATLVLHENTKRIFRCPRCGLETSAKAVCRNCTGWRLRPLGVGTERVEQEIHERFPVAPVMLLEEKILANPRVAAEEVERFMETDGSVLVATEGVLPYLTAPVSRAIIVSADSFLCVPEYSAGERAAQFLAACRDLSHKPLIIQTRLPEHPAMLALAAGNWDPFIAEDLALRQQLSYPPHVTLIRLSMEGPAERIRAQRDAYLKALAIHNPQTFPGVLVPNPRAKTPRAREHILLRLPAAQWPDLQLLTFLRALPPSIEIIINPQSVFND